MAARRSPFVVLAVVLAGALGLVWYAGQPITDHVPLRAGLESGDLRAVAYRCAAPFGAARPAELARPGTFDETRLARPPCNQVRARRRLLVLIDAAVLAALAVGAVLLVRRLRAEPSPRPPNGR
ncbi:MAG: hypothetical protein ACKVWR_15630 [Acidimicrobiales bacterium]